MTEVEYEGAFEVHWDKADLPSFFLFQTADKEVFTTSVELNKLTPNKIHSMSFFSGRSDKEKFLVKNHPFLKVGYDKNWWSRQVKKLINEDGIRFYLKTQLGVCQGDIDAIMQITPIPRQRKRKRKVVEKNLLVEWWDDKYHFVGDVVYTGQNGDGTAYCYDLEKKEFVDIPVDNLRVPRQNYDEMTIKIPKDGLTLNNGGLLAKQYPNKKCLIYTRENEIIRPHDDVPVSQFKLYNDEKINIK